MAISITRKNKIERRHEDDVGKLLRKLTFASTITTYRGNLLNYVRQQSFVLCNESLSLSTFFKQLLGILVFVKVKVISFSLVHFCHL